MGENFKLGFEISKRRARVKLQWLWPFANPTLNFEDKNDDEDDC